ncbi:hypothetical protein Tco_0430145, partial [Tanacetum coccineum]
TLEQLDWSLVGKIQVVAADRLWEHIPIVGLMVVENKRCGEWWIDTHLLDKYLKEVLSVSRVFIKVMVIKYSRALYK